MMEHFRKVYSVRPENYGNRPNRGVFDIDGESKLRNNVASGNLDSDNPKTLQMLCSVGLSTNILMRVGKEQALLLWSQVNLEYVVSGGEYKGSIAVNIRNLIDKTNKHQTACENIVN